MRSSSDGNSNARSTVYLCEHEICLPGNFDGIRFLFSVSAPLEPNLQPWRSLNRCLKTKPLNTLQLHAGFQVQWIYRFLYSSFRAFT